MHAFIDHKQSLAGRWLHCEHEYAPEMSSLMAAPLTVDPHKPINYDLFCSKGRALRRFAFCGHFYE